MKINLSVSVEYLNRELNEKDRDVQTWIIDYSHRNHIPREFLYLSDVNDSRLSLSFKSRHQLEIFVRKGNQEFPYFEFR